MAAWTTVTPKKKGAPGPAATDPTLWPASVELPPRGTPWGDILEAVLETVPGQVFAADPTKPVLSMSLTSEEARDRLVRTGVRIKSGLHLAVFSELDHGWARQYNLAGVPVTATQTGISNALTPAFCKVVRLERPHLAGTKVHGTEATAWALLPKDAKLLCTVLVHGATVSSLLSTDKPSAAEHTPSPTATRVVERLGHAQATDRRLSRLGLTALNGRTPHTHSRAHPCLDCCTHFTARENGSANDYIVVESHLDLARCHCRVDAAAAIGNSDHRPVLARIPVAFSSAGSVSVARPPRRRARFERKKAVKNGASVPVPLRIVASKKGAHSLHALHTLHCVLLSSALPSPQRVEKRSISAAICWFIRRSSALRFSIFNSRFQGDFRANSARFNARIQRRPERSARAPHCEGDARKRGPILSAHAR